MSEIQLIECHGMRLQYEVQTMAELESVFIRSHQN